MYIQSSTLKHSLYITLSKNSTYPISYHSQQPSEFGRGSPATAVQKGGRSTVDQMKGLPGRSVLPLPSQLRSKYYIHIYVCLYEFMHG